jgi:1-acyl-sn-glycerol-3-phosphate acyltransferase
LGFCRGLFLRDYHHELFYYFSLLYCRFIPTPQGNIDSENLEICGSSGRDFLYFIGLTRDLGIAPSFMAKRQLFQWPLGRFMRDMGGVEINREAGGNYVQAMIDEFARRDEFLLTIAPEGTRRSVAQWRTGFYHIAMGAGVPLIVGMMDYAKKMGGLAQAFMPSGDYAADMTRIEEYYRTTTPRHPHKAMQSILAASDKPYARAA